MKIVSEDFCIFTGVSTAIYIGPCRRSYILLVRKISNFQNTGQVKSNIQAVRYQFFPLSRRSIYFFHLYENLSVRHTY